MKRLLILFILLQGCSPQPEIAPIPEEEENPVKNAIKLADTEKNYIDHSRTLESPYAIKRIEKYSGIIKLNNGEVYQPHNPRDVKGWAAGHELSVRPQSSSIYDIILVNLNTLEYVAAKRKY